MIVLFDSISALTICTLMNSSGTTTFKTLRERAPLGYLLHEVSRLMKRRFEEEARAHGVTMPQWRALAQISDSDGITQVALAQAMDADPMTVSSILDRLEKRQLITRQADPSDSRAKVSSLTEEGIAVVETARAVGAAMYEAALVGVAEDEAAAATRVLQQMRENLLGQNADAKEQ